MNHLCKQELLVTYMPTKVGEPVIGRVEADGDQVHVYKFRAIELDETGDEDGEDDYGEDEGDEGGTDPFVPPKPSTVTRVLHFVQDMKAELFLQQEQMLRLVEARLGEGTEGVDGQPGARGLEAVAKKHEHEHEQHALGHDLLLCRCCETPTAQRRLPAPAAPPVRRPRTRRRPAIRRTLARPSRKT